MMCKQQKSAFTLIELLVVIAIISLLVSILLPTLSKAKEQAQITACMVNLRGIGTALLTYASEYDGYPPEAWDGLRTWARKLKNNEYATAFQCPAHNIVYPIDDDEELRSYSLNEWITLSPGYSTDGRVRYRSMDEITQPAISGLSAEVWRGLYWDGGGVYAENTVDNHWYNINALLWFHNPYYVNDMGFHGEDRNQSILFYDGHAESYPFVFFGSGNPYEVYGWKWYMSDESGFDPL